MREKQVLPVAVVGLTAALVAVIALWTLDRVGGDGDQTVTSSGPDKVIEWKLVTTWPKGLPGLGAGPENFARRVNEASGGRMHIKVFGAGEIVPAFEVFDAVSRVSPRPVMAPLIIGRAKFQQRFLHGSPFRYDRAGGERMAPLWGRPRVVARAVRTIRRGALCRW